MNTSKHARDNVSNLMVTRYVALKSQFLFINVAISDSATLMNSIEEMHIQKKTY